MLPTGQARLRSTVLASFLLLLCVGLPYPVSSTLNYHDWDSLEFRISSPPSLTTHNYTYTPASYGDSILNPPGQSEVNLEIVLAWPDPTACSDLRDPNTGIAKTMFGKPYTGKMMLIQRGDCTFGQKSLMAQYAGAAVALIFSCSPGPPHYCRPDRVPLFSGALNVSIPTIMIDYTDGSQILSTLTSTPCEIGGNNPCNVSAWIKGTSAIHPSDRAALTRMSQDISFEFIADRELAQAGILPSFSSINNSAWDPCVNRIQGIWCEGNPGRIVILDLDSLNLTGILSPAMGDLTSLQQLILSSNNFWCTTLPCSFGNLVQLRVLGLFHMGLLAFQPEGEHCLDSLAQLQVLDASFNEIQQLTMSMAHWPNLQALDVSNNQVTTELGQVHFAAFARVEYLSLENNFIEFNVTGVDFRQLTNIGYLMLGNNMLHGQFEAWAFDGLSGLFWLDLSRNNIEGRLPSFNGVQSLAHLDLSHNSFQGNMSSWIMPQLQYLSVGNNMLSEPQERLPAHMPSLLYMDLSFNNLTVDPAVYNDVGAFLFGLLPLSIETVHLESNNLRGSWGTGFLQTYNSLAHVFLSYNQLQNIPDDIFSIGSGDSLIDLDLSFNEIQGQLPSLPPAATTVSIKFNGNPKMRDVNGALPTWVEIDPLGNFFQPDPDSTFVCASLTGKLNRLTVFLDPSYYTYEGCQCQRGTYGSAPHCVEIPTRIPEYASQDDGTGSFSDGPFGDRRFFVGIDTNFILGTHNLTGSTGTTTSSSSSSNSGSSETSSASNSMVLTSSLDAVDVGADAAPIVRAIYITFNLNRSVFATFDDQIAVYQGAVDLRGGRVAFWTGDDDDLEGNIDLGGMFPPMTVTILGDRGVVNFQSRQPAGTHFVANFTLSSQCPPGYLVWTDDPAQPNGYCALPAPPGGSSTVILLLVASVIIGILCLCLLGQKMSTIQGLINGSSLQEGAADRFRSKQQAAQEIYGPVLSVEEAWRRQLKRDLTKELFLLLIELAGYASNWAVVVQQVQERRDAVLSDSFLVGYMSIVVSSTVTGCVSVFTRVRVMREIYTELAVGVAVVPTIDMLLHHTRKQKGQKGKKEQQGNGSTTTQLPTTGIASSSTPQVHSSLQHKPSVRGGNSSRNVASEEWESSPGPASFGSLGHRSRQQALSAYGRPLLGDSPPDSADFTLADSSDQPLNDSSATPARGMRPHSQTSQLNFRGSSSPHDGAPSPSPYSIASSNSSGGNSNGNGNGNGNGSGKNPKDDNSLRVRLSSKDPNVQLAWVQRTIATTKLTSFNLFFSTLPFLVLNQVRLFRNSSIRTDWLLQLSSLWACMLLGVKLMRILALWELQQRRNQLVFEVITMGAGKNGIQNPTPAGGGGLGSGPINGASFNGNVQHHSFYGSGLPISQSTVSVHPPQSSLPPAASYAYGATPAGQHAGPLTSFSIAKPAHYMGDAADHAVGGAGAPSYDSGTFLLAPATSFMHRTGSSNNGVSMLDISDPFAPGAAAEDETAQWAASNYGSTLEPLREEVDLQARLMQMHAMGSEMELRERYGTAVNAALPHPVHPAHRGSVSAESESGSWIAQHMASEAAAQAATGARGPELAPLAESSSAQSLAMKRFKPVI